MSRRLLFKTGACALALGFVAGAAHAQAGQAQTGLPMKDLTAGINVIHAEIAATPGQREIGLMFRTSLPANGGMLFIFDRAAPQCFWMHNTLVPLSAAFIATNGAIINIADMAPKTDTAHCSNAPALYVLEMPRGWFKEKGIKAGDKIDGLR